MSFPQSAFPKVLTIYLELSQYPIMAAQIRARMRKELFNRGIITEELFETEVQRKAVESQHREGLGDPFAQEEPEVWAKRMSTVRDNLTDFYFAHNLPHDLFADLVRQVMAKRVPTEDVVLSFHPELAPWDMLFAQGAAYEALPKAEREPISHHLKEIKVVLIKSLVSGDLRYVGIAKEWLDISDLQSVRNQRFGRGRIGGKAAGVILASTILRKSLDENLRENVQIPRSWFIGSDVMYDFVHHNDLLETTNQKYKAEDKIRADYPAIRDAFAKGRFGDEVVDGLRSILDAVGDNPLIVRSSSLLEDSFGTSFAGKYDSFFCPIQASRKDNLRQLIKAIGSVYSSVYSPDVLMYRQRNNLVDYDERMAILIQEVQGEQHGRYFMPTVSGVAFSQNQFRWSARIDREAGFMRLVWGLGTRAVDKNAGDYPRLVAISHPELRPVTNPKDIQTYSQKKVDLIDLESQSFTTVPVPELVTSGIPNLNLVAGKYEDGLIKEFIGRPINLDPNEVVITFDGLLRRTSFVSTMRDMLRTLEAAYRTPVDTEFAVSLSDENGQPPNNPIVSLLQCRPLSHIEREATTLPTNIPEDQRLFLSKGLVPDGRVSRVRYVVYIKGDDYAALDGTANKRAFARLVGRINQRLKGENYILIGPGRWGSTNPDLGIPVTYSDIHNARALVEITHDRMALDPSYGTHFFQDLVEARIYPLALSFDDPEVEFKRSFFEMAANALAELLPEDADWSYIARVIDVPEVSKGAYLELVMDGEEGAAMAYLAHPSAAK